MNSFSSTILQRMMSRSPEEPEVIHPLLCVVFTFLTTISPNRSSPLRLPIVLVEIRGPDQPLLKADRFFLFLLRWDFKRKHFPEWREGFLHHHRQVEFQLRFHICCQAQNSQRRYRKVKQVKCQENDRLAHANFLRTTNGRIRHTAQRAG